MPPATGDERRPTPAAPAELDAATESAAADGGDGDEGGDEPDAADVDDVEPDECCICRDAVELRDQGFLPTCAHKFHFECIVAWSKVTNLCPLCKQSFREVTRVDATGAVVHREEIRDVKQVFRPDPGDHDIAAQLRLVNEARCEVCGRGDDEHVLLLCEARGCPTANHTYCIGLSEVPSSSWYCSRHASGTRASDFIERPATTVSTRRTTRRLAHLMSNVLSGRDTGAASSRRSGRGTGAQSGGALGNRARRPAATARVTLDSESGRPIRGIAAAYALRMSQELQQINRRAELMYARGDHNNQFALSAPANRQLALSRSTTAAPVTSFVDLMWQDFDASRLEMAALEGSGQNPSDSPARPQSSRISPTLTRDYRELAKLMVDAVGSDNYASTVSLVIPKTAKLRLVSRVKSFFARLNSRESVVVLDMGCLAVLHKWIQQPDSASVTVSPHPQVLEAVLAAVEGLPVRKNDLVEVPEFQSALDEIAGMADIGVELRERAILTSEKWRALNPPPQPAIPPPQIQYQPSASRENRPPEPALPAIRAFSTQKQPAQRSKEKERKQDAWTEPAVEYVKAKLYPLYKHGNGKLSKDRFKAIVKQVSIAFKTDADAMQSQILLANGELSSIAKARLKTLIDRAYKGSSISSLTPGGAAAASSNTGISSYSAVPHSSLSKHRRIS